MIGTCQNISSDESSDQIRNISKSKSLHVMGNHSAHEDYSEGRDSPQLGDSSGVFSCSVDISDVCFADLTKLADSTAEFLSESVDKSMDAATTPISMALARPLHIGRESPLTPSGDLSESSLSPQIGASDEYLRRHIVFINRQLNSLMTQLVSEDKYFETCTNKYEEIIANLREEIDALKGQDKSSVTTTEVNETAKPSATNSEDVELKKCISKLLQEDLPLLYSYIKLPKEIGCNSATNVDHIQKVKDAFSEFASSLKIVMESNCTDAKRLSENLQKAQDEVNTLRISLEQQMKSGSNGEGSLLEENSRLKYEIVRLSKELQDEKTSHQSQTTLSNRLTDELFEFRKKFGDLVTENILLKDNSCEAEGRVSRVQRDFIDLQVQNKKLLDAMKINDSALILENSKMKGELKSLHSALDDAQKSSEKNSCKFNDLQKLYDELHLQLDAFKKHYKGVDNKKMELEKLVEGKDIVLRRLCSNFNELLAIFRECQELGLDDKSSAEDIDDGFMHLKRRLLDLSKDYITLNNKNKVLGNQVTTLSTDVRLKAEELENLKVKQEVTAGKLRRTVERVEAENKMLLSQKIDQEDLIKELQGRISTLTFQRSPGCKDCTRLRNQLQQLQIDIVDKDASISTLELHIKSCCEYNKKKLQQYKHELHSCRRQLDAHVSFAGDFGLSPKKTKSGYSVDVGTQAGESFVHHLSGGFVERFKIRELEEKVIKLEKEKTVLKRLCKIRADRIQEIELSQEGRSVSSPQTSK